MNRPLIRIQDLSTNEVIEREMNDEEFLQCQIDLKAETERLAIAEAEQRVAEEVAIKKAAIVAKLGITADEAKLLLS